MTSKNQKENKFKKRKEKKKKGIIIIKQGIIYI